MVWSHPINNSLLENSMTYLFIALVWFTAICVTIAALAWGFRLIKFLLDLIPDFAARRTA